MDVTKVALSQEKARKLFRDYKKHQHYSTPIDREIQRTYQLIAQGKVVIRALDSIVTAGLNDEGRPKLAIAPATSLGVRLSTSGNGSAVLSPRFKSGDMSSMHVRRGRNANGGDDVKFPNGSFSFPLINERGWNGRTVKRTPSGQAFMPLIPVHLRPKRGIQNYHVLWEAEWKPVPPVDPYLLRRIGKADLWLVVAAWDLTEVEQAALASRVMVQ